MSAREDRASLGWMPRLVAADPPLPPVFSHAQARAQGLTSDQIRHRVRSGRWERLARGYYRSVPVDAPADEFARRRRDHLDAAIAAAARHGDGVIALRSAVILLGLPLFTPVPHDVSLMVPYGHWAGHRPGIVFHHGELEPGDVVNSRVRVTTPARTWLDIARTRPLTDALTVGDAAVRARLVEPALLTERAGALKAIRGCRRAVVAASHVNGLRETPLESGSWAYFVRHGVPLPLMQVAFDDDVGRFIGRVDFYWEKGAVVGECDGRLKYASGEDLYAEKRREDALRALGLRVVRWGWQDLGNARLAAVLRRQRVL